MNNINLVSANVGAISNDQRLIFKVPSGFGGITILGAEVTLGGAGTTGLNLVDMGTGGTTVAGTIATKGSAVYVANVPQAMTVSTAFVDEGHYVGVEEANIGAANAVTIVSLSYLTGY